MPLEKIVKIKRDKSDESEVNDEKAIVENIVICPVCGHGNSESEGHCKMCSAYLY